MPQLSIFSVVGGQIKQNLRCTACALSETTELLTNRMDGSGVDNPTYMIVGVAPGWEDDKIGKPMTGANGRLLQELLRESGIPVWECFFTNCLRCCTFKNTKQKRYWNACKDYLIKELREKSPKVIIASGADAIEWLTGERGIDKLRGRALPCTLPLTKTIPVFPIMQPAALFHVNNHEEQLALRDRMIEDLTFVKESVVQNKITFDYDRQTDYQVARTPEDVDRFIAELEQHEILCCDCETGTTDFEPRLFPEEDCHIISIGFSWGPGIARAFPLYARGNLSYFFWDGEYLEKTLKPKLKKLLETKTFFGHNFVQFDQKWIRHEFGIERVKIDFDTMYAHHLIDEERGTHSLKRLAAVFTTVPKWKERFTLKDTEEMCQYLCHDVDVPWRLRNKFEPLFTEKQRWLLHEVVIPLGNVFLDMECRGVKISRENLGKLHNYLLKRIDEEYETLRKSKQVRKFELLKGAEFNPESPIQVADFMENFLHLACVKRTNGDTYSTDAEVLGHYDTVPEIQSIHAIRRLRKLDSTYCGGLERAIDKNDRVHTTFNLTGTVTGRPSSEHPNLLNIPREETAGEVIEDGTWLKQVFTASEGRCLVLADYSQIEVRILACISGDKNLLDIYKRGEDVHLSTAAKVYGIPHSEVTKAQRTLAKSLTFGIIYGKSEEGIIKEFIKRGNTESEGRSFYEGHKKTFPGVWQYMADQERIIRTIGFQETSFGHRRRYSDFSNRANRQAYNFPIQSTASVLTLVALVRCASVLKKLGYKTVPILTVYDSIMFDTVLEELNDVVKIVKQVMEGIKYDWIIVPIKVDIEIGLTWGKMQVLI